MYILRCSNGSYYTGSTSYLETRIEQHQMGMGANFTRKHLPVKLVYFEEFDRIDFAFYREKQVQGPQRQVKSYLSLSKETTLLKQHRLLSLSKQPIQKELIHYFWKKVQMKRQ